MFEILLPLDYYSQKVLKKMKIVKVVSYFLFVTLFSFDLSAQTISPRNPFILNLDYARFSYNNQSGFLEIYYEFHPQQITYELAEGNYHGGVKIVTLLRDSENGNTVVDQKSHLELSEADTTALWYRFPFITRTGYAIPYGDYTLTVLASDSLDLSRSDSVKLDITIKPVASQLAVSDLELCKQISASKNKDGLFYKNSLDVVPYPSLVFGGSTVPVAFHYVEIYNSNPDVTYTVKTEILDSDGTSKRKKSKQRKFKTKDSVEVGGTPLSIYPSGKYTFRFSILDENESELVRTDKVFYILNQHIQVAGSSASKNDNYLASFSNKEISEEFRFARYLATKNEIAVFNELKTLEGKREFLYNFWRDIERGRGDIPPLRRSDYVGRVEIANSRYGTFKKKGWKADQGRIFLIYSTPDEIERAPHQSDTKPYEIWRYFSIENGVEFIFADRYGFGELELVHSTKRGEIMDEDWQRYIGQ